MNTIKEKDITTMDLANEDLTLHMSRKEQEEGISKKGLVAQIGENSKGHFGREETSKVFFTKSIKGTLLYINRMLNMIDSSVEGKSMDKYKKVYGYFNNIYDANYKEGMSREEEIGITHKIIAEYLNRSVIYNCNLNYSTQEEYNKMSPLKKAKIDYLLDDTNEERKGEMHTINNMHTIRGKGISKRKLEKLTINGSDSALDVTKYIIEQYKQLHPNEPLPCIDEGNGRKDNPMLEGFYSEYLNKEKNETFIGSLKDLNASKDDILKKDIMHEQDKKISKEEKTQEVEKTVK